MRFGIVVYPGTWSEVDCYHALHDRMEQDAEYVWHKDTDLSKFDAIVVPGGFSYGDYLRCGAIARFSPVTDSIHKFADQGKLVIGICNGFQILCEAGLLPGALLRNEHLEFRCQWTNLRVENASTAFSNMCHAGQVLKVPISHGEGRYFADPHTLVKLEMNNQVVFRYCNEKGRITAEDNPNGSTNNIAGIINARGNVLGMMPHPERAVEGMLGGTDGIEILASMLRQVVGKPHH